MTIVEPSPIACTLTPGAYKDRLAWIAALNRDALRKHARRDLVLELSYAPEARERVREMVRNEQRCCAFLGFELHEGTNEVYLTVTAPETAREAADALFEPFIVNAPSPSVMRLRDFEFYRDGNFKGAAGFKSRRRHGHDALDRRACLRRVLRPAVCIAGDVLAGTGAVLAWFAKIQMWAKIVAVLSVLFAWGWIAWQSRRTRRKPALSTLVMMVTATTLLTVSMLWPCSKSLSSAYCAHDGTALLVRCLERQRTP